MKELHLQHFLRTHEWHTHEDLVALMKTIDVAVRFDDGLILFIYYVGAKFTNPVVRECRGIILYEDTLEVACYPFNKFMEYNKLAADKIDWNSAVAYNKMDGTMISLWYDKRPDRKMWRVSTMKTIDASKAKIKVGIKFSDFGTLFDQISTECGLKNRMYRLDKNHTYVFELISPHNQVVIKYDKSKLYHLTTREMFGDFKEIDINIGVDKPISISMRSLEDVLAFVDKFDGTSAEGVVVCDKFYGRIKVRITLHDKQYIFKRKHKTCSICFKKF